MAQNRLQAEREDVHHTIRLISNNIPGHEDRMKDHCERLQKEYFDKSLNNAGRPKKT